MGEKGVRYGGRGEPAHMQMYFYVWNNIILLDFLNLYITTLSSLYHLLYFYYATVATVSTLPRLLPSDRHFLWYSLDSYCWFNTIITMIYFNNFLSVFSFLKYKCNAVKVNPLIGTKYIHLYCSNWPFPSN